MLAFPVPHLRLDVFPTRFTFIDSCQSKIRSLILWYEFSRFRSGAVMELEQLRGAWNDLLKNLANADT